MNLDEFFDKELAAAREDAVRREKAQKTKAVAKSTPQAHFRPFLQAMKRMDKKFESCTEIDFQYGDNYFRLVLGEQRVMEVVPTSKKKVEVVTHFLGYKVSFLRQPFRFLKQFITELYLRMRLGNFLRYLFSTYEYPPWDVIERRRTFDGVSQAAEFVIRALAEFVAQIEVRDRLRREAAPV